MGMRGSSSWLNGESEASLGSIRPCLKNKMNIDVSVLSFTAAIPTGTLGGREHASPHARLLIPPCQLVGLPSGTDKERKWLPRNWTFPQCIQFSVTQQGGYQGHYDGLAGFLGKLYWT